MAVIRKTCDTCGQPIELRQLGPDKWRPYNPDGSRHHCAVNASEAARAAGVAAQSQAQTQSESKLRSSAGPQDRADRQMDAEPGAVPAAGAAAAPGGGTMKWVALGFLLVVGAFLLLPRVLNRDGNADTAVTIPEVPTMSAPPTFGSSGSGSGSAPAAATRTPKPRPTATARPDVVPAAEAPSACAAFTNQVWAQTMFDRDPRTYADLDPDRDGFACEELPYGAVPALWTDRIPAKAEQVQLISTIDGDTIVIRRKDGRTEHVRLVGIDTPETGKGTRPLECYGEEATDFTRQLLQQADGKTVWLEMDQEDRDRYDRLLRYVWYQHDEQIYMANDAIVRAGYAERYRDTPNRRYYQTFIDGQEFARGHGYGLWSACK
jgi:micrococcal nuclease